MKNDFKEPNNGNHLYEKRSEEIMPNYYYEFEKIIWQMPIIETNIEEVKKFMEKKLYNLGKNPFISIKLNEPRQIE